MKHLFKNFLLLLSATFFFSACTSLKTNDFTAQKYTKFKKGHPTVQMPVRETTQSEPMNIMDVQQPSNIALASVGNPQLKALSATDVPVIDNTPHIAPLTQVQKVSHFLKRKSFVGELSRQFMPKANMASVQNGDAELLLLVILAIILPPLAVLIARDLGTEFWIDLILTLLGWIPGQVYALLIVFDII